MKRRLHREQRLPRLAGQPDDLNRTWLRLRGAYVRNEWNR